jgi:hypothetical protein
VILAIHNWPVVADVGSGLWAQGPGRRVLLPMEGQGVQTQYWSYTSILSVPSAGDVPLGIALLKRKVLAGLRGEASNCHWQDRRGSSVWMCGFRAECPRHENSSFSGSKASFYVSLYDRHFEHLLTGTRLVSSASFAAAAEPNRGHRSPIQSSIVRPFPRRFLY